MTGLHTHNHGRQVDTQKHEPTPRGRPTFRTNLGIEHHRAPAWYRNPPPRPFAIAATVGAVAGVLVGLIRHFP